MTLVALATGTAQRPASATLYSLGAPPPVRSFTLPVKGRNALLAPAGRALALWSADKVELYDLDRREARDALEGIGGKVAEARFSWDGRFLLTRRTDGALAIWEAASGKKLGQVEKPGGYRELVFLPGDAGLLAVSFGSAQRWGLDGKDLGRVALPGGAPHAARGGTAVAVFSGKEVRLVGPLTGKETAKLAPAALPVTQLRISDDGRRVFGAHANEQVTIWDVGAAKPRLLACQTRKPMRFSAASRRAWDTSADGRWLVTACTQGSVVVWDATAGTQAAAYSTYAQLNEQFIQTKFGFQYRATGTGKKMYDLRFLDDSRRLICTGGSDFFGPMTQADLWTVRGSTPDEVRPGLDKFRGAQSSRDGSVVAFQNGDTLTVHDLSQPPVGVALTGHLAAVRGLAFSPDGARLYTASEDGSVREWAPDSGRCLRSFEDFPVGLTGLAVAGDGKALFVLDRNGRLERRDLATGAARPLADLKRKGQAMRLLAAGRTLLVQVPGWELRWFSTEDDKEGGKEPYRAPLALHPDGRSILFPSDLGGKLFRLELGDKAKMEVVAAAPPFGAPSALAFSPDGKWLAQLRPPQRATWPPSPLLAEVWGLEKKERARSWSVEATNADLLAYAPGGKVLAVAGGAEGGEGVLSLWNAETGRPLAGLPGHRRRVLALAFSPDGRSLASADEEGVVRVWNLGR
jgi:WD40 repeat protein